MKNLLNKIHHADCLEFMRSMPDKCVDLCLTDPPYGIIRDISLKTMRFTSEAKKWDNKRPNKEFFDEIVRISNNQIIWGMQYFVDYIEPSKGVLFWDKKNGSNFMSDGEIAYNSTNNAVRIFRYAKIGKDNFEPIRYHPTQKPIRLFKWCIQQSKLEKGIVFDPFSGSGTTALACHDLGLDFICVEKDEDYYKASIKRLEEHQRQGILL